MFEEFKKFAMRGNVMDLAVGVIIGASFTGIITSLVNDVIMPPIGLALGGVDFSNFFVVLKGDRMVDTLAAAKAAKDVTINYGLFINAIINFLIVAFVAVPADPPDEQAGGADAGDGSRAAARPKKSCCCAISAIPSKDVRETADFRRAVSVGGGAGATPMTWRRWPMVFTPPMSACRAPAAFPTPRRGCAMRRFLSPRLAKLIADAAAAEIPLCPKKTAMRRP